MDYQQMLAELQKLNPKHKRLAFFRSVESSEEGQLHHNMLLQEIDRIKRISGAIATEPQAAKEPETKTPAPKKTATTPSLQLPPSDDESEYTNHHTRILKQNPHFRYEDLSDEMKELYNCIGDDYKKMSAFHAKSKLENIPDDERKHATNLAAQIEDRIAASYAKLDAWITQQRNPEATATADAPATDVGEKLKRLANLRSYVTKQTKKLADLNPDSEKFAEARKALDTLEAEKQELEAWKAANNY